MLEVHVIRQQNTASSENAIMYDTQDNAVNYTIHWRVCEPL